MADKFTTTETVGAAKKVPPKKDVEVDDSDAAVQEAYDDLRQAMLDRGDDEGTVDAKLRGVRPTETNIVGNFADLQRIGAQLVGETGGIADAVLPPAEAPTEAEEASAGEVK